MAKRRFIRIPQKDTFRSAFIARTGAFSSTKKGIDEVLQELVAEVQESQLFDDGKTFVDLVPREPVTQIKRDYSLERNDPQFDLRDFVSRHFYQISTDTPTVTIDESVTMSKYIKRLWPFLERKNYTTKGSLLPLPYPYIVPGGRFNEQFYWDSYFVMLGLAAHNKWDKIENMMKNYAYMMRQFGFIPTANRSYFLSRSQPPFFSHMVKLLAKKRGRRRTYVKYLPYLIKEHRFWMDGIKKLDRQEHSAYSRIAKMPNGQLLNRYYDNKTTPRPESLREDTLTATEAPHRQSDRLFLHLRAAAESGWDFSSRWCLDPYDLKTIHTADIIPVDLNCLLYHLETTIAQASRLMSRPVQAKRYERYAANRKRAIQTYCWDETAQFYADYNFHQHKTMEQITLAGVFPLYVGIATSEQAAKVADRIEKDFLKTGGLITTLLTTDQQWDAPNGWAPLQWVAIKGLRHYGYFDLANKIKSRWIITAALGYAEYGKLVEKYNVQNPEKRGGGGEYILQDGFGWTNGVLASLMDES